MASSSNWMDSASVSSPSRTTSSRSALTLSSMADVPILLAGKVPGSELCGTCRKSWRRAKGQLRPTDSVNTNDICRTNNKDEGSITRGRGPIAVWRTWETECIAAEVANCDRSGFGQRIVRGRRTHCRPISGFLPARHVAGITGVSLRQDDARSVSLGNGKRRLRTRRCSSRRTDVRSRTQRQGDSQRADDGG
jgi:hypothetical protein